MVEIVAVEDAVGKILSHDITRIVPGEFKGSAFKKGHCITEKDIPRLKKIGKDRIYVLKLGDDYVHENDAARRIAKAICGPHLSIGEPDQGRISLVAECSGLLHIEGDLLLQLNNLKDITIATLHGKQPVSAGKAVAATRIVPLFTERQNIERLEEVCRDNPPPVSLKPFRSLRVGLITTGNEIFYGRIKDRFGPQVISKFDAWGSEVFCQRFVPDKVPVIADAIRQLLAEGAEMIVLTGGMSVDPDDVTPDGIRASGAQVISYGAPAYPGAMFMLAELEGVPILGLPACAMYHRATIVELVAPRLLAGETVTRADIVALGQGGLCTSCRKCRYPDCGFGK